MSRPKVYKEPRISTVVRFPPDLHERLLHAAEDRDVSANWLMNRAVVRYLDTLDEQRDTMP